MFFRFEGCLLTIRKTVMSSSQGSEGQAVQKFLTLKIKARHFSKRPSLITQLQSATSYRSLEEMNLQQHRYVHLISTQLPRPIIFFVKTVLK